MYYTDLNVYSILVGKYLLRNGNISKYIFVFTIMYNIHNLNESSSKNWTTGVNFDAFAYEPILNRVVFRALFKTLPQ